MPKVGAIPNVFLSVEIFFRFTKNFFRGKDSSGSGGRRPLRVQAPGPAAVSTGNPPIMEAFSMNMIP